MQTIKIGNKRINRGFLFVLPCIIFFSFMILYPALKVFFNAFFIKGAGLNIEPSWQGLYNFEKVFKTTKITKILKNTLVYALGCTVLHTGLGMIVALVTNSTLLKRPVQKFFRTLTLVPWAITPTVVAIMAQMFFHPSIGPVQKLLTLLGYKGIFDPLGTSKYAMATVILTNVWKFLPFYFLIELTAMQSIDTVLHEAAIIDGANRTQDFFHITLPMIRNQVLTLAVFDFVSNASYFDITWIMTQGGPMKSTETLATLIYKTAFQSTKFGEASAMGVLLFVISLFVTITVIRIINKE